MISTIRVMIEIGLKSDVKSATPSRSLPCGNPYPVLLSLYMIVSDPLLVGKTGRIGTFGPICTVYFKTPVCRSLASLPLRRPPHVIKTRQVMIVLTAPLQ